MEAEAGDEAEPNLKAGLAYWNGIEATLDGVMGGFGDTVLPKVDARGSRELLKKLLTGTKKEADRPVRILDVGAGVGRVTSDVLLHPSLEVDHVDLLEPCLHFVNVAMDQAANWRGLKKGSSKVVSFWQGSLQDCQPHDLGKGARLLGTYPQVAIPCTRPFTIIWCQWCLPHLKDHDLVQFFIRCKSELAPGGYIVVKENLCKPLRLFDVEDSSVTRSETLFLRIFKKAGLKLIMSKVQQGLPKGLFQVKSFVLQAMEDGALS